MAGENLLSALLAADVQNNPNTTSFKDLWAKPIPAYPIEDGAITGKLVDQASKFNLNDLYHDGAADPVALAYFKRLLTQVGLPPTIASAALDWETPPDASPTDAYGAKNSFYLGQNPSYQAANRSFLQVEELKKVRGFEGANYQLIAPYVTALPLFTPININTASATVLTALDDSLKIATVNGWVTQRNGADSQAITQVQTMWSDGVFSQVPTANQTALAVLLDVKSSYFEAQIDANLTGRDRYLTSEYYRNGQNVYVWRRSLAPNPLPAPAVSGS